MKRIAVGIMLVASVMCFAYQPAKVPLMTEWGEKVTPENAWRSYPRPQLKRSNWTNLNGEWDYAVTSVTNNSVGRPKKWDGKILVPYAIESALSGVGRKLNKDEFLWYTRTINCSPKKDERILLHFGAVDFRTMVFIGHTEVTDIPHEGGHTPFTVDITDYVKEGENELSVCVWDPTGGFINSYGKQVLRAGGIFYTRVSGIWQTVWMETVPKTYVESYTLETDIDKGEVTFKFKIAGPGNDEEVDVEIFDGDRCVADEDGDADEPLKVKMPKDFKLWSPDTPNLYTFKVRYEDDEFTGYFGMRKIEKRKDAKGILRFYLNNKPCFIMGTLDQGWWPDGLLTPPSEAAIESEVKTLKEYGFNAMRKHIKIEPLVYYEICDRLGILLVQDLPSASGHPNGPLTPKFVEYYHHQRYELKRMIDTLQMIPSIVVWCPYNEGWGQPGAFLTHSTLDFVKRYDATRLVDGPSGCWDWEGGNILPEGWDWNKRVFTKHKPIGECEAGDIVDMHHYSEPRMFEANERRISFLGEYGGLGLLVKDHFWANRKKTKPTDPTHPQFGENITKAYLKYIGKINEMSKKGLSGAIYTQTTDVEDEVNGILTYDRKIRKMPADKLNAAHKTLYKTAEEWDVKATAEE